MVAYCNIFNPPDEWKGPWPPQHHAYYSAYKYMHSYPKQVCIHELSCRNAEHILPRTQGRMTDSYFKNYVLAALELITLVLTHNKSRVINWDDRCRGEIGRWNHGAHFDDAFTHIWDG